MAQTFENLEKYQGCSQEMIEQAVHQATAIVKGNLKDFTDFSSLPIQKMDFIGRQKMQNGPQVFGPVWYGWLMSLQRTENLRKQEKFTQTAF